METLKQRLSSRKTESEETLQMRVDKALIEMEDEVNFDQVVVNDVLDDAISEAEGLVKHFINS